MTTSLLIRGTDGSRNRQLVVESIPDISRNGRHLWNSIYEPYAEKLLQKLGRYHPDFPREAHKPDSFWAHLCSNSIYTWGLWNSIVSPKYRDSG